MSHFRLGVNWTEWDTVYSWPPDVCRVSAIVQFAVRTLRRNNGSELTVRQLRGVKWRRVLALVKLESEMEMLPA